LMAIGRRAEIAQRLLDRGWPTATPAAVVLGAATPGMHAWRGTLGGLITVVLPESSAAGTIVIGEVAALPIELMNGFQVSQEIAR
jgi:siroheme synthase